MEKNTGKVREKSGNFVSPEKWEPWLCNWWQECILKTFLAAIGAALIMDYRLITFGTIDTLVFELGWRRDKRDTYLFMKVFP